MEPDDGGITWLYIARQIWGRGSQDTAGGSTGWGERRGPGRPARGRGAGGGESGIGGGHFLMKGLWEQWTYGTGTWCRQESWWRGGPDGSHPVSTWSSGLELAA